MDSVGIALEVFAAVVTAVLIVVACCRKNIMQKPECYVLLLTCSNFLMLLCDLVLIAMKGNPGAELLFRVLWVLDYAFVLLYILFLHYYLVYYIAQKAKIPLKLTASVTVICAVMLCLWIISMFNGMFYSIDKNNIFSYSRYFILSQLGPAAAMVIDFVIILKYRRVMGLRDTLVWMTYIILPTCMIALENKYDVVPVYLAMTVSIMIIYIMISMDQDKRMVKQELELSENREKIMLSQIQPHFLYNALTSIAQLCDKDPAKAKEATIAFSEYLRRNMDSLSRRSTVPFNEEMKHLSTYLLIEKLRFGDYLNIVYDIEITDFNLPILTLQPIVENAVKHGVGQKDGGGTVRISTAKRADCIEVTVSDDGVGFDPNEPAAGTRAHVGLENVRSRLSSMCGGEMTVKSEKGVGTTVTIIIPKEMD